MYGGNAVETKKVSIKATDNLKTVDIPTEFIGKDVVVNFIVFTPEEKVRRKPDPRSLLGIAKDTGLTLDELRYERLMAKASTVQISQY